MNIKVCGITEFKQMQQLDALNVDFVGIIFHADSPRYIGEKLIKKDIKKLILSLKKLVCLSTQK
jgi:phosphoribosylanthranilate isomerase